MALRGAAVNLPWPFWGLLVTLLAGLLLGGHQWAAFEAYSVPFSYGYWVLRLLTAYLLFVGCLLLLELSPLGGRFAWGWLAMLAAAVTLPFFTLSVTMLDLLLGLPELGLQGFGSAAAGTEAYSASAMAAAFALESLYHLDHYLALCALIVVPRLLLDGAMPAPAARDLEPVSAQASAAASAAVSLRPARRVAPAFFARFDPPLEGPVFAVQAQEHYIRVITAEGAPCTLYRFGDALRELDGLPGLQVHRSFWVADDGVAAVKTGRRGLRVVLRNGEQVPVSAKHADLVQRRYGKRLEPVA